MVIFVTSKAAQCIDYEDIDAALLLATIGQQLLKFSSVDGFCGFALFNENGVHDEVISFAVFAAGVFLRG